MAITEQEKQEIIDELLAEIRANGLDYSGQTITFPDAFNVTQTERQNVKIPAIDERSATPVHGNVDLESLLTAYGVTHVEEIASDIASNYMKKTADSELNMNGYALRNVSNIQVRSGRNRIVYMPETSYSELGVTQGDYEGFFSVYMAKVVERFPNLVHCVFKGVANPNVNGDIEGYVYNTTVDDGNNYVDANGVPYRFTLIFKEYGKDYPIFCMRTTGGLFLRKISTFDFNDITKDNRINASGVSEDGSSYYIRYENGLQICWGQAIPFTIPACTAWNPVSVTTNFNFPMSFSSGLIPACLVQCQDPYNYVIGAVRNGISTISSIEVYRHSANSEYTATFKYIAIGKWK